MLTIREQLEQTRSHLLSTINGLTHEQLNKKIDESTWSIAQVVEHISKVERGSTALIGLGLQQEPNFVPDDIPLEQKVLDRSVKLNAPERVQPSSEPRSFEDLASMLNDSRTALMTTLDKIEDATLLDKTAPPMPHPVFGMLSTAQWITASPLHEERHIAQIKDIKSKL